MGRQGDEDPITTADADASTAKVSSDYYEKIGSNAIGLEDGKISQGLICFRVWQIFDYMVDALEKKKDASILLLLFSGWCLSSVKTFSWFEPGQPLA